MSAPILLVEDEKDIRDLITLYLRRESLDIVEAKSGEEAAQLIGRQNFSLAVLDWMLPGLSGIEILKRIRENSRTQTLPVLMVTARAEPKDVIEGLENGADDYVTKPFEPKILVARVKALLRRAPAQEEQKTGDVIELDGLEIYPARYEVKCKGTPIQLTHYEFKLLLALVENVGRVLTRNRLIELVQGEGVVVIDRAIDTHVFGLRKKLGECADLIETIRGVGYRVRSLESK